MKPNYLKNINITTLDIDKNLNPNVIGNVLNIPFRDNCFDTVVAFEVLEHLSHNSFSQALSELLRVTSSNVILSLPDTTKVCSIKLKIPKVTELKILIPVPHLKRPDVADAEHYWEIGTNGFLLKKIIHDIESVGLIIIKTYRIFENPYHRFFLLKKSHLEK